MANARFPEFVRSTEYRRELGLRRKRAIQKMYSDIAKETENKINAIQRAGKWTGTTVLQMKQLRDLQKSIDDSLKNISAQIEKDIVSDMKKVAEVTCADVAGMMKRIGLNVGAAYAHVPELAVKNIVSGNLYGQRWNFSKAVWGDYRKASGDLAQIVAKGLAQNRPIYDIAKDLEKYVNPNVRKDFDWSRRYPGSKKKVDYNAYRLAQTMSTHAHQQAVIIANRDNPLFDGVEWHSSGSSRTCPLCEQRDGEIFPFDKCPMDHPMGQCTLSPHMKTDSRTAAERIGDWIGGKSEDPELDKFAETLGYTDKSQMTVKPVKNTPSSNASANNAAEKLSQLQKASDELGKAVKDFGKSVDGFEKAVGNLQNAAKGLTSGGNGGIINFKDASEFYHPVTDEIIDKIPNVNYFSTDLNEKYRQINIALLQEAKKHDIGVEVSAICNEQMERIGDFIIGKIGSVRIADSDKLYHGFHNHPSDKTLSIEDLEALANRTHMLSITAQGNEGSNYCFMKTPQSNKDGFLRFLKSERNKIIFTFENKWYTYNQLKKGKLDLNLLSDAQRSELKEIIIKLCEECAIGGEKFGYKYFHTAP